MSDQDRPESAIRMRRNTHPDERIAWTSHNGAHKAGVVTFHRLDDNRTKIMPRWTMTPKGSSKMSATP
jgi:uncharacterized membrane protein